MEKGKVIVVTAPSGAGKTTLAQKLLSEHPNIIFSVSATTRPPRPGEVHGKDYYFLSREEFEKRITRDAFIEWEEFYNGILYGTLRSDVEYHLNNGYFVLFDVDVNGAVNIKNIYGSDCISLFIKPPDIKVLETRLKFRGTENEQTLKLRMSRAKMELKREHVFDHVIVNDDFNTAYRQMKQLVTDFMNN